MVKVFAPVNIAWIKYMGKSKGLPTNSSLSFTLDQIGTTTTIKCIEPKGELQFRWSPLGYIPPVDGQEKAERFLRDSSRWSEALKTLGFPEAEVKGTYEIETRNNVPAGTGIATSASGFAALALAWFGILTGKKYLDWKFQFELDVKAKRKIAELARYGSGSACRSFEGPLVEWHPTLGTYAIEKGKIDYLDFILLFETEVKEVSSSEAHLRVASSPRFSGRTERAEQRLTDVKKALATDEVKTLSRLVLEEAIDMHDLFHSSHPPFSYLKPESKDWIKRVKEGDPSFPSQNAILTLDAGANCHLFVPSNEEELWESYLSRSQSHVPYLKARCGKGAYYVDESF